MYRFGRYEEPPEEGQGRLFDSGGSWLASAGLEQAANAVGFAPDGDQHVHDVDSRPATVGLHDSREDDGHFGGRTVAEDVVPAGMPAARQGGDVAPLLAAARAGDDVVVGLRRLGAEVVRGHQLSTHARAGAGDRQSKVGETGVGPPGVGHHDLVDEGAGLRHRQVVEHQRPLAHEP